MMHYRKLEIQQIYLLILDWSNEEICAFEINEKNMDDLNKCIQRNIFSENKDTIQFVLRKHYLNQLRGLMDKDFIKIFEET